MKMMTEELEPKKPTRQPDQQQVKGSLRYVSEPPDIDSRWCGGPGGHDVFVERIEDV
jgi:hypothetical protein